MNMLIGTDIEQISRIEQAIARRPGFLTRVFTAAERDYCARRKWPAQHYAARFCAKEAVAKALGEALYWQDVEVVQNSRGMPGIRLSGMAARIVGGRQIRLSLSHSGDFALATVLVE